MSSRIANRGRRGAKASAPLAGIRVLEVGSYIAGPYCGLQLADLGADVIKVEQPDGGDQVRLAAPFLGDESSPFVRLNRNKRSLVLDLKRPAGVELFRKLVLTADIVIENLRPGVMTSFGLDYVRLAELNPRLIYVAASGWGQDGPLSQLPGVDIMAQARAGLMSITGEPGGAPVKVGVPVCDLACALYGTIAALAALRARDVTGTGQLIDVSLFESGVSLAIWEAGRFWGTGEVPDRLGSAHQNEAPYQAVRSADGWLTIGASTRRTWPTFCRALGLARLIDDPRYIDSPTRHSNRQTLIEEIEQVTTTKSTSHWVAVLEQAGVPCAPIQRYDGVFSDPHLLARDYYWDAPHPKLGQVRQLGSPMRLSSTPVRRGVAGPMFGEHSLAILEELGVPAREVAELVAAEVVLGPDAWAAQAAKLLPARGGGAGVSESGARHR